MELKLRRISKKFLWPMISGLSLAAATLATVITITTSPKVVPVLVATSNIAEGEPITSELVSTQQLPLGTAVEFYLQELPDNLTAVRSFEAGELLTKSGFSNFLDPRTPIRLNGLPQISKSISVGDLVDLWATSSGQVEVAPPQPVVFGAIVVAIEDSSSLSQTTTSVELRIPIEYLEGLLAALEPPSRISLILNETLRDLD